ncbi:hypothetical protein [Roseateles sp. BYS96W]|uniref:Uncharacterized protein n=1 Tax=Pelomonas nitida TaxID=3299027 RepID=A0ABW7G7B9_9BURK
MTWHIQPTRVTARLFGPGRSFEHRDPPDVIAQVDLTADGHAYIHATMSRQDGGTPAGAWRELVRQLRRAFGVTRIDYEHKGRDGGLESDRLYADTVQEL